MEIPEQNKKRISTALFILVMILSVYFVVKILGELKKTSMLGENNQPATISFSGHGEVQAVPDIANVYFTISKDAKTAKDAQAAVAVVEKKSLNFLREKNVAEKDIKTDNASVYPKYDYTRTLCTQMGIPEGSGPTYNCGNSKQVLVGYTASESITVKVRKVDDAGAVMQGLGTLGVSNLSGPNFAIDDEDELKAEARKLAIDEAKSKAKILAKDLDVSLVKIVDFSESGNYPMMYSNKLSMMEDGAYSAPASAQLPKGENTISSDVTITYEIR